MALFNIWDLESDKRPVVRFINFFYCIWKPESLWYNKLFTVPTVLKK